MPSFLKKGKIYSILAGYFLISNEYSILLGHKMFHWDIKRLFNFKCIQDYRMGCVSKYLCEV